MHDTTDRTEKLRRGAGAAPVKLNPVHQKALEGFDKLPDSAKVPVQVVAAREGVSPVTVWRRVKAGLLPAPVKVGGTTRWIVGELRAAA
jgi:predicted DNA-binding transcriptional regulator AlpA